MKTCPKWRVSHISLFLRSEGKKYNETIAVVAIIQALYETVVANRE